MPLRFSIAIRRRGDWPYRLSPHASPPAPEYRYHSDQKAPRPCWGAAPVIACQQVSAGRILSISGSLLQNIVVVKKALVERPKHEVLLSGVVKERSVILEQSAVGSS